MIVSWASWSDREEMKRGIEGPKLHLILVVGFICLILLCKTFHYPYFFLLCRISLGVRSKGHRIHLSRYERSDIPWVCCPGTVKKNGNATHEESRPGRSGRASSKYSSQNHGWVPFFNDDMNNNSACKRLVRVHPFFFWIFFLTVVFFLIFFRIVI